MTSSGTYVFDLSIAEITEEAFERVGQIASGINIDKIKSARRSMNLMFSTFSNRNVNLWAVDRIDIVLTAGVATFDTPQGTIDLFEAMVIPPSTGLEISLSPIGRDEYALLPNKDILSQPTQYWVDKILPAPRIYLYPTPDIDYPFAYYRVRQLQDVSAAVQTADAPYLWQDAICAGLAARLAEKFAADNPALIARLEAKAEATFLAAQGENRERVPIKIRLDTQSLRVL